MANAAMFSTSALAVSSLVASPLICVPSFKDSKNLWILKTGEYELVARDPAFAETFQDECALVVTSCAAMAHNSITFDAEDVIL